MLRIWGAYAGQSVIVSFEIRSGGYGPNLIDGISLTDDNGDEFITNGGFETGDLTGWSTNEPSELQNFTSAAENLADLTVTRSFYTVPDKLWGRWVDVLKNETGATIETTVQYFTNLGSDNFGILYRTPGTRKQAITCWDGTADPAPSPTGSKNDRDVALVFGAVDSVTFTSATAIRESDGNDEIYHRYDISVEPGESVAIVNFIIMNGVDTGETAADVDARATAVDAAAKDIVVNFWKDNQYRSGMTQEQIDAILNF